MSYYRSGGFSITRGCPNRISRPNRYRGYGLTNRNPMSQMYDMMENIRWNNRRDYTTTYNMDRTGRIRNVVFNSSNYNNGSIRRYWRRRYFR